MTGGAAGAVARISRRRRASFATARRVAHRAGGGGGGRGRRGGVLRLSRAGRAATRAARRRAGGADAAGRAGRTPPAAVKRRAAGGARAGPGSIRSRRRCRSPSSPSRPAPRCSSAGEARRAGVTPMTVELERGDSRSRCASRPRAYADKAETVVPSENRGVDLVLTAARRESPTRTARTATGQGPQDSERKDRERRRRRSQDRDRGAEGPGRQGRRRVQAAPTSATTSCVQSCRALHSRPVGLDRPP